MTKEDKARIARENGAKSRGPKTEAGKAQSRLNSIKTGENAQTLAQFVPPNSGILCQKDRKKFYALIHQLTHIYLPANKGAARHDAPRSEERDRILDHHRLPPGRQQPQVQTSAKRWRRSRIRLTVRNTPSSESGNPSRVPRSPRAPSRACQRQAGVPRPRVWPDPQQNRGIER